MKNRVDKLKRKMEAKRKSRKLTPTRSVIRERDRGPDIYPYQVRHDEEREDTLYQLDGRRGVSEEKGEPLFSRDRFIMQILASVCLFFVVGILFQTNSSFLEGPRNFVHHSFQEDFQFGTVAGWYEDAFGRPLALLPPDMSVVAPGDTEDNDQMDVYALPASGTIRESFQQNGRGIYVETDREKQVEAIRGGTVRFMGEDEAGEWGKVVVIRHYDGIESWYGMLDHVSVQLHEFVEPGDIIGTVSHHEEKEDIGVYYFALKDGDNFIDPVEVITID
ncbi:M23 family metallopeptidase [Evansella tamaricis]|uniref:M23 family metallopeptidase n=1 Tax=Evansella tamaricis TaxID=2069301 RepID=A0ABS6J9B8_9BACI|nr:M23 family metallopeptidase [Evansella tamaricis]MBU9710284.1 M23 family metallopeptidase [Evansella tamaricis]